MSTRYEIEEGTNAVMIFYGESPQPSLYQPNYPGGDAWADAAEAAAWAELYIESIVNEDAPYAPGNRGEEGGKKPTAEEIAKMQAELEARRNPAPPVA
jgi:hypothetical protein